MDPTSEEMAALASRLSNLSAAFSKNPDGSTKKALQSDLVMEAKKVISQCQAPFDTLMDQVVDAFTIGAQMSLLDIGVFEAVPPVGSATVSEIAKKCDADEALLIRLMRQLTCRNIFTEVNLHEWAHNKLSIVLSEHVGMTGKYFVKVALNEMYPPFHHFNEYMQEFGRTDVLTYTKTPHSWYNKMLGSNFWEVLSSNPARLDLFNRGLSMFSAMHPVVAMFPFEEALQPNNSPSRVLAVDIGGGRGAAMLELRSKCPSLQGSLILQDRPIVLDEISSEDLPGVTKMVHDFFEPQPVQGAQIYHIRRVMHDWQDADAVRILKAIKPAMAPDSRIIIADMAMPEPATPPAAGAIWMDLMMLTIGGKERTHRDWANLADMSGLLLVKIWQEPDKYGPLCMVEYVLPAEGNGAVNGHADIQADANINETNNENTNEHT